MAKKDEHTSKRVATIASQLLRNTKSSKDVKSVAGEALTNAPDHKKLDAKKYKAIQKKKSGK